MIVDNEVTQWFDNFEHPLKDVMLRVRALILAADARMGESIKWQSPTFSYKGNLASFNPRAKKHVSLMFHTGASIPGEYPHLHAGGHTSRYMTFATLEEVEAQAAELGEIVRAWVSMKG